MEEIYVIDHEKKEARKIGNLSENDTIEIKKNKTPKQLAIINSKTQLGKLEQELGGYVQVYYVSQRLLYDDIPIDKANITRFLYLATYIDYDNREPNLLVIKNKKNELVPMTRKDMQIVMKLSKGQISKFLKEMKDNNLIFETSNRFYINDNYATKGKMKKDNDCTRLYINPVRNLYENCTSREHKLLSYIYQLIPFADYNTNFITINNEAANIKTIMQLLGLSTDNKNAVNKFKKKMLQFHITYNDNEYYLFGAITREYANNTDTRLVINPRVLWSGNNLRISNKIFEDLMLK
ncbi:hypothetical protein [Intestinibacter bartlettii]|uniref:hypothetical protein n=1 Tax=Intestinibacter bartlettii TaxID=261299 RepID=UPI003992D50C